MNSFSWQELITECRKLEYVEFAPIRNGKHVNSDYPSYLSKYCASIAAGTFYPVVKYFEIPAAGCLTFMEVTENNNCKILGFKDGENAVFINEKNYQEKFLEIRIYNLFILINFLSFFCGFYTRSYFS